MVSEKSCVIAQPTFMPWIGWFDLADQSDVFVILDDVAFSKQSWQQRNRIRTPKGLEFITVPVQTSGRTGQLIKDCEIVNLLFLKKIITTLQANYSKALFFHENFEELIDLIGNSNHSNKLVEINFCIIKWMAKKLKVATPTVLASDLNVGGKRGEHVAAICEAVGANHYLSTIGAEDYLKDDISTFNRRGIKISIHNYEHPNYAQCFSPFNPYASAIDLIFNEGPNASEIMRSGRRALRLLSSQSHISSEEN
jgi:hypothetical protein